MKIETYNVSANAGRPLTKAEIVESLLLAAEKVNKETKIIPAWLVEWAINEHAERAWYMWNLYNHQLIMEKALATNDFEWIVTYLNSGWTPLLNEDAADFHEKRIMPWDMAKSSIMEIIKNNKIPEYMLSGSGNEFEKIFESILGDQ